VDKASISLVLVRGEVPVQWQAAGKEKAAANLAVPPSC